ncbi:MAG: hypothetical protein H7248_10435 [Microbacteriaceae bacterium]|nr:hypothetical protein [Microbacteriaceae bacterium]
MRKSSKTIVISAAVVAGLLATGSAAFAFWSVSGAAGTSSGTTASSTTNSITVNPSAAAANTPTGMTPGGPATTLIGTFSNTSASSVNLKSLTITATPSPLTNATNGMSCSAADYTVTAPTSTNGFPQVIAANATAVSNYSATVSMNNTGLNQNGCLGATLTFAYTTGS